MGVELGERKNRSGNISLVLDYYYPSKNGKHKQQIVSTGLVLIGERRQDKEAHIKAEAMLTKARLEFDARTGDAQPSQYRSMSFREYYEELIGTKNAENTRSSWNDALIHFVDFTQGQDVTFGEINREFLEQFKNYLLKIKKGTGKISTNTVQIYFSRIKTALAQAVKDGKILSNPAAYITIKKTERLPVFLTLEEVQMLAATPCGNDTIKNAFLFSCFSGLRISDLINLTFDNVSHGGLDFTQQKTGTPGRLPLAGQALAILERQKETLPSSKVKSRQAKNAVFVLPRQSTVDKQLKRWARKAGVNKNLSMHKARHTFATLSLSSGVDLYTISKLLGHKNIQTTQIYAQATDDLKKAAVAKLPTIKLD